MSCKTCDPPKIPNMPPSEYKKAELLAAMQAEAENKVYVVVKDGDIYYPECLECRNKEEIQHGTIVAYIR